MQNNEHARVKLILGTYIKLVRSAESVTVRSHRHLAEVNLTFGQFAVLEALHSLGTLIQKDLAKKILKSPRNITMIVDNLEKRSLVERSRNESDRRYYYVSMTEKGKNLFESILPKHKEALVEEFSKLSNEELIVLGSLCRRIGKE
jgi:MarR family 2-MHQ and catechol resistance regulon transcriptional repressor